MGNYIKGKVYRWEGRGGKVVLRNIRGDEL